MLKKLLDIAKKHGVFEKNNDFLNRFFTKTENTYLITKINKTAVGQVTYEKVKKIQCKKANYEYHLLANVL